MNKRYGIRTIAIIAALVTFALYLPTLGNGFVNWDDPVYFSNNPYIRHLDWGFFKWLASAVISGNWHPLTMLSHAMDFRLFGAGPLGPHLINNVLHAINTALVAMAAFRLVNFAMKNKEGGFSLTAAFITALLFGLHPQHVESVAWISERKDLLSALFYILSLLSYLNLNTNSEKKALHYIAALLFMLLALLSKPMAITIPIALLLIDFYPLERIKRNTVGRILIEKVPFFALSLIFVVITLATQKEGGALKIAGIITNLPAVISAYAFYLYKMVMPLKLSPLYPYPITLIFSIYKVIVTFALATILTFLCNKKYKNPRLFIALWVWFVVTLLPVIGIMRVGTQGAADRYTYLPTISLYLIAGLGIAALYRGTTSKRVASWIVVISATLLIALTIKQIAVWKEPVTLWSSPIENFSKHVPLAYINRAMALEDSSRLREAVEDYSSAIKLQAGHAISYNNRGNILNTLGEYARAIKDFNAALKYKPNYLYAYNNRGISYMALARYELAISDFLRAIKIDPLVAEPYKNLSDAYLATGREGLAKKARKKALELGFKY